jgi:hypothetical protein
MISADTTAPAKRSLLRGTLLSVSLGTLILVAAGSSVDAQVPASVRANSLRNQIIEAYEKRHDPATTVRLIEEYKTLQPAVPFLPPYYLAEAVSYAKLGDRQRAMAALSAYFNLPMSARDQEKDAEALYAQLDAANRRESSISWAVATQGGGQSLRQGEIEIDGKKATLIGVTLTCTFVGLDRSGLYVRLYEDPPTDARHLPTSSFPSDFPLAEIGWHSLLFTMHMLTGESAKHFPDNRRPPWEGWYSWNDKQWHNLVEQGVNGVVLWDRNRGTGPFGDYRLYNELLLATFWQERHWNRVYELHYLDSYKIAFPSLEPNQSISFAEDLSDKGPGDPDFCQVMGRCETLKTNILNRFEQLKPIQCKPKPYQEPDNLAQAFANAKR